jgi:hypothetical protein
MLLVTSLDEDPSNPRTEVPEAELDELAEDIRQHGILQAIVVHPADAAGRHLIHFGAKRWRAAQRIGLPEDAGRRLMTTGAASGDTGRTWITSPANGGAVGHTVPGVHLTRGRQRPC